MRRAGMRRARPLPPQDGQAATAVPAHVPHPASPSDQRAHAHSTPPLPPQVAHSGRGPTAS